MALSVSVVIEGFNEANDLGVARDTVEALRRQDFPLQEVELILVGGAEQVARWSALLEHEKAFGAVRTLVADGAHYYQCKNIGAAAASAPLIALTDSDVCPDRGWLTQIVTALREGADVAAGMTLYKTRNQPVPNRSLPGLITAMLSWGFVAGGAGRDGRSAAAGFLSGNVGFRAAILRRYPYRVDFGRTCADSFLFASLVDSGVRIVLQPDQNVAHSFSFGWWLTGLHARFGYDLYTLRRENPRQPMRWVRHLGVLEPPLTMAWRMLLDLRGWLRVARLWRIGGARRIAALPLLIVFSALARGSEMLGMYLTMIAPRRVRRWAENS